MGSISIWLSTLNTMRADTEVDQIGERPEEAWVPFASRSCVARSRGASGRGSPRGRQARAAVGDFGRLGKGASWPVRGARHRTRKVHLSCIAGVGPVP
jgi:hypothetical protein